MTIKNEEKVRNWENIILRCKQTSLSMTQFCKSENFCCIFQPDQYNKSQWPGTILYLRYLLEKMTFMKSLDKESLTPLMPQNFLQLFITPWCGVIFR